jgi:hypothetical protein
VLRLDTHALGAAQFGLLGSGERVNAMCVEIGRETPAIDRGGPLYLLVHSLCLQLADCFIDSIGTSTHPPQALPSDRITSIKQLWQVLYRRLYGSLFPYRTWELPEPHEYFVNGLHPQEYMSARILTLTALQVYLSSLHVRNASSLGKSSKIVYRICQ